jgi:hypothetical protein
MSAPQGSGLQNQGISRTVHLAWLLVAVVTALLGFWARGRAEQAVGEPPQVGPAGAVTPSDLLAILAGSPRAAFPVACPVCGGKRDTYATVCASDKVCFNLVRCKTCGSLAFLQIDLSGKALVSRNGDVVVVDSSDTIRRGSDATRLLESQGKMGVALIAGPEGLPMVRAVVPGMAAEAAGLRVGDKILRIGNTDCTKHSACEDFSSLYTSQRGRTVPIRVLRDRSSVDLILRR